MSAANTESAQLPEAQGGREAPAAAMTARLPGFHGGIGQAGALAAVSPRAAGLLAQAFAVSFAVALAISVLALVPASLLPRRPGGPLVPTRADRSAPRC